MKKNILVTQPSSNIKEYAQILLNIKQAIAQAQTKASLAVNKELLLLYWNIGKQISLKMETANWGTKIVDQLAADLQSELPGIKGFSRENIYRMVKFYQSYVIVSQLATQLEDLPIFNIPWFHNVVLMMKIKDNEERLWYAHKTIVNGWSRNILERQIAFNLYHRQGKAITNFSQTLPQPHSDLAQEALKDPYISC